MKKSGKTRRILRITLRIFLIAVSVCILFVVVQYMSHPFLRKVANEERSHSSGMVDLYEYQKSPLEMDAEITRYKLYFLDDAISESALRLDFWYGDQYLSRTIVTDSFYVERHDTYKAYPLSEWEKNRTHLFYQNLPHRKARRLLLPFILFTFTYEETGDQRIYNWMGKTLWINTAEKTIDRIRMVYDMDIGEFVSELRIAERNYGIPLPDSTFARRDGVRKTRPEKQDDRAEKDMEAINPRQIQYRDTSGQLIDPFSSPYILFDFWYSACLPCHRGLKELDQNLSMLKQMGIGVYAVNPIDDVKQIQYYLNKYGYRMDVLTVERKTQTQLRFQAYPTTLLYNRQGIELYRQEGVDPDMMKKIERAIMRDREAGNPGE